MYRKQALTEMPKLAFSATEEKDLRALSTALESEVVDQYEQFLFRHRRRVDTTRWKSLRNHDESQIYIERDDYRKSWRHESKRSLHPGPMASTTAPSSTSMLFVTASVQGTLDDALFGATFIDTASLRVRDSYLKQTANEAYLLGVIDAPDDDDPFRFLGVTYSIRKRATSIGRSRDLLLLTGVHTSKLSTGERIGIVFHHSITHDAMPEDTSTVRATASMVAIYRQLDNSRIDVFILDFCDLHGKTFASTATKQAMTMLAPWVHSCNAGVDKKLHWLVRERHLSKTCTPERDSSDSPAYIMSEPRVEIDFCDICDSVLRGPGRSPNVCQLCGEQVCGKCVMSKDIVIDVSAAVVEKKRLAFCVGCIYHAKTYSAVKIAQQEVDDLWIQSMVRRYKQSSADCERSRSTILLE